MHRQAGSTTGRTVVPPVLIGRATQELDTKERRRCTNTGQGRLIITDSAGYRCERSALAETGCCVRDSRHERFGCAGCSSTAHCCNEYEACVACCMSPSHRTILDSIRVKTTHSAIKALSALGNPFEVCRYRCRTSSGSIVHENSYRSTQVLMKTFHLYSANRIQSQLSMMSSEILFWIVSSSSYAWCFDKQ